MIVIPKEVKKQMKQKISSRFKYGLKLILKLFFYISALLFFVFLVIPEKSDIEKKVEDYSKAFSYSDNDFHKNKEKINYNLFEDKNKRIYFILDEKRIYPIKEVYSDFNAFYIVDKNTDLDIIDKSTFKMETYLKRDINFGFLAILTAFILLFFTTYLFAFIDEIKHFDKNPKTFNFVFDKKNRTPSFLFVFFATTFIWLGMNKIYLNNLSGIEEITYNNSFNIFCFSLFFVFIFILKLLTGSMRNLKELIDESEKV